MLILATVGALPAYAADPVPLGDFFRRATVTEAVVSPSGRYIAMTQPAPGSGRQRLVVVDLQDLSKSKPLAEFSDADILRAAWVNDKRLVFSVVDRLLPGVQNYGSGLFSVAIDDGLLPRRLIKGRWGLLSSPARVGVDRELSGNHSIFAMLRDGSDDVIVQRVDVSGTGELNNTALLRLNTATGTVRAISEGAPERAYEWALDPQGMPRAAVTRNEGRGRLYLRPDPKGPWVLNREYELYESRGAAVYPIKVTADGKLFAIGYTGQDRDTRSLLRLDLAKPEQVQDLMSLDGYDYTGGLILGTEDKVLGISYLTDAHGTYWFDARLKKIQADVDAALPGMINDIHCGLCANPESVLVASWSDRQPVVYRLYDTKANTLVKLADSRPWIDASRMAKRDFQRFNARDGLSIPTFVTRPPGVTGAAPMVVLVHGGPFMRVGEWDWDQDSQFLASRGYVVVEPQFRGSTGFGSKLFRSGWKQWGLAMQDDIADAANWAVKQGYADPKRICIAGASYGGYATLMGLVRDPDLYRCGFEWVGVTDIDLMYSVSWSDASEEIKTYQMPLMIGDPVKDAKQLADTSPLKQAARITRPLLMAHGGVDRRVPIVQGTKFRDAVRVNNPNTEWVEYPLEGHGWFLEATDLDFWGRVERFLDKNLKNAP